MEPGREIERLIEIMAALRHPETGCPWDVEQTFATIAPYTVEEAHEVADAIARDVPDDIRDELGDLLLQVVYHARLAEEAGLFAFPDVVEAITGKMIRRHPHVFGDEAARSAGAAKGFWEAIKAGEKRRRAAADGANADDDGLLSGVPASLPTLARALKLQRKAATVGFDWDDPRQVLAKIREELVELEAEFDAQPNETERIQDEIGDLLFAVVNLARHAGVDADHGLRRTNAKFIRRIKQIEKILKVSDQTMSQMGLHELERLWQETKTSEGRAGADINPTRSGPRETPA